MRDRGLALLVGVVELHELLDRGEERGEVEDEGGELADRRASPSSTMCAADEQDQRLADDADDLGAGAVDARRPCAV